MLGDFRIVQRSFFMISDLRANRPKQTRPKSAIWAAATAPSPCCEIFDGAPKSYTYHKVMQHFPITQVSAHLPEARAPLVPPPCTSSRRSTAWTRERANAVRRQIPPPATSRRSRRSFDVSQSRKEERPVRHGRRLQTGKRPAPTASKTRPRRKRC